jgi:hypothetical protein
MNHLTRKRKTNQEIDIIKRQWGQKATVQRYKVQKKETKIFSMELSKSSKHLLFFSFQTPKKADQQFSTIFQIAAVLGLLDFH